MGVSYSDNLDSAMDSLWEDLPSEGQTVTWANVMEYARALHVRDGYFVLNPKEAAAEVRRQLSKAQAAGKTLDEETISHALDAAGFEHINWLLEKIEETQPPVNAEDDPRQARQGSWSDVTGMLAHGYKHKVNDGEVESHDRPEGPPDEDESDAEELPFD